MSVFDMRTGILAPALLGLLLLAPLAAAQAQQPTLTMDVTAPDQAATPSTPAAIRGIVEISMDAVSASLAPNGIQVDFVVAAAPAWAVATVTPSSAVLHFDQPQVSTSRSAYGTFEVLVYATAAEGEDLGQIQIEAVTRGSQFMASSASLASVVVVRDAAECHHEEAAADATLPAEDLSVQSAATPATAGATSWAAIAIGTAAVAGVALTLRRRFF